jgi:Leucine-rich repeat (LRR) protein
MSMSVIGNRYIYFRNNIDSVIDTDLESILQSKGWSVQGSLDPLPFDITANWSLTTPDVVDEASFRTFLESGQDGNGNSNNLSSLVIRNFSLINGRLSCNLSHTSTNFYLSGIQISNIESIGNVKYLQNLNLNQNQIVNFDPAVALPDSLEDLLLSQNQIVTFNPSIALPDSLRYLYLDNNQIVDFDPSIALPTGLKLLNLTDNQIVDFDPAVALPNSITNLDLARNQIVTFNPTIALPNSINVLGLGSNQMTTAGYIASEPWANSMSVIPGRGGIWIGNNINSINGTNLESILQSKGWNVVT